MGPFDADGDDGYDRSDEEDDFRGWSDKRRAAPSSEDEESPTKAPPKTLTERLADSATDREIEDDPNSDERDADGTPRPATWRCNTRAIGTSSATVALLAR